MPITEQLLDELLNEYEKPEDLLGDDGLLHQLTKALVERALEGEMTHHLGYKSTRQPAITRAIPETGQRRRRSKANADRLRLLCRVIGIRRSSRNLSKRIRFVLTALMKRSYRFMPEG